MVYNYFFTNTWTTAVNSIEISDILTEQEVQDVYIILVYLFTFSFIFHFFFSIYFSLQDFLFQILFPSRFSFLIVLLINSLIISFQLLCDFIGTSEIISTGQQPTGEGTILQLWPFHFGHLHFYIQKYRCPKWNGQLCSCSITIQCPCVM